MVRSSHLYLPRVALPQRFTTLLALDHRSRERYAAAQQLLTDILINAHKQPFDRR